MKEGGNVTVLAQLHIWHKSHTLPGSPICTVCLYAPLLLGSSICTVCLFAPLLPDPLPRGGMV